MEVLLPDKPSDEGKKPDILAAIHECRNVGDKVSQASAFIQVEIYVNSASAFRH
jgi:hypothetical protein